MTDSRIRSVPATSGQRGSHNSSVKDAITAMKYSMPRPSVTIYPLDDTLSQKTFPDYSPWEEDRDLTKKLENLNYLNKGFFETPRVSNEYYSARNLVQETVFSSSKNCNSILRELSQHLTKSYKTRDEVINKIRASSFSFKIPLRVTLTALKKEAWLKELANPDQPLHKISSRIPHGLRNKVLVDAMCSRQVPISRAIWFTKCSLFSELVLVKKKALVRQHSLALANSSFTTRSNDALERRWLQEWTQQVADYVLKFSKEMKAVSSHELKSRFQERMNYLILYVLAMYIEELLDKTFFLTLILRLIKEDHFTGTLDILTLTELQKIDLSETSDADQKYLDVLSKQLTEFGQLLIALIFIRVFWKDIIAESFLRKHLSESLLLNYLIVSKLPTLSEKPTIARIEVPHAIKSECLSLMSEMIIELFHKSSSSFIIPSSWIVLGDVLHNIINSSNLYNDPPKRALLEKSLALLKFRNESLIVNCGGDSTSPSAREDSSPNVVLHEQALSHAYIHRSNDDVLKLIDLLDHQKLREAFTLIFTPGSPNKARSAQPQSIRLKAMIFWCVSTYRDMGVSKEKLISVCNALKMHGTQATGKSSVKLRIKLENEILESIFCLAELPSSELSHTNLYALVNELYQLKIITISAYLRKLIASGIFYLSSKPTDEKRLDDLDPQSRFHLLLLQNLPLLNNRQCDHILKKWAKEQIDFIGLFEQATRTLREGVLDHILNNTIGKADLSVFESISELNVGLQFMVMNWFTSEFKTSISKASKLVHITPDVVAFVYELFIKSNNLTAFFKLFIKFILKNENKVLIFYMDSLYFISRLILDHSTLLEFIAGNSSDSPSASLDIFKLIVQDYRDLLSRETDIFQFGPLWEHIRRQLQSPGIRRRNSPNESSDANSLGKRPASTSPEFNESKSSESSYETEFILEEVQSLEIFEKRSLTADEYKDITEDLCSFCGVTLDYFTAELPIAQVKLLLRSIEKDMEQKTEIQIFKLISNIKAKETSKEDDLVVALKELMEENLDIERFSLVTKFILALELMTCDTLLSTIQNISAPTLYENRLRDDLFEEVTPVILSRSVSILFQSVRLKYKENHLEASIEIVLTANLPYDTTSLKFRNELLCMIVQHPVKTVQSITKHFNQLEMLDIMSNLLGVSSSGFESAKISSIVPIMSEFNLPIVQVIISILAQQNDDVEAILNPLLSREDFFLNASFFGELFNLCDLRFRIMVFKQMESLFLNKSLSMITSADLAPESLTPIFKDFFSKINDSFVDKIDLSASDYKDLLSYISQFISCVEGFDGSNELAKMLLDNTSILLRIIIIQSGSLIDLMMQLDLQHFELIHQLVRLFNTKFMMHSNERLKILLYDLLHLFKNSLTQQLTLRAEEDESVPAESPSIPKSISDQGASDEPSSNERVKRPPKESISTILTILDIPEPSNHSIQTDEGAVAECLIMLDRDELLRRSDIKSFNNNSLVLASSRESGAFDSPFGELSRDENTSWPFTIRSVQLIEETGGGINDGCINLALLRAYTTKENVP